MESYKLYEEPNEIYFINKMKEMLPEHSIILQKNHIINQFLAYGSLEEDLNFIISATGKLIDYRVSEYSSTQSPEGYRDDNLIVKKSLFISIITTYGKCFNKTNKRRMLDESFIKKNFPDDLLDIDSFLKLHKKLINLRNTFIAHSDHNIYESQICYMKFKYNIEEEMLEIEVNYMITETYTFDEDQLELLILICSQLRKNVTEKKNKTTKTIIDSFSKEELQRLGLSTLKNGGK
ncbi:hypothetical protein [Chryseobacterium sp. KMC2]|jgi:hypothetical protein|uniref:hypothetical protein n=1 Tax=Chryseobacterium sp. KMC2 TaxID=2800705 RepID=UPI000647B438|nr:hypothetical protein [Chryseobacterium sp. KMC2]MBL3550180.1 hypothetical protein [Chryseobacterium sp. KMC2]